MKSIIEIDLPDYCDDERRAYGATLTFDVTWHYSPEVEYDTPKGSDVRSTIVIDSIDDAWLFAYDQDGGKAFSEPVDALNYITKDQIKEQLS